MDKWTKDTWLEVSLVESYEDSEDVTLPAAEALVEVSGILGQVGHANSSSAVTRSVQVLDNGAGMAQVTESLLAKTGRADALQIVCGDIDLGLLRALRQKQREKAWSNVKIAEIDATNMDTIPDHSLDYIFGNFLYFLVSDPVAALKESFRALRSGGTLSFTTWSLSGPFELLQLAQARLDDYPSASPNSRLLGGWNHPRYVRSQLDQVGMIDIKITPYPFAQKANSATEMSRKMRHVIMLHTAGWGSERKDKGWELGDMIEKTLREQQGDGPVQISSAVLLVTAKRP